MLLWLGCTPPPRAHSRRIVRSPRASQVRVIWDAVPSSHRQSARQAPHIPLLTHPWRSSRTLFRQPGPSTGRRATRPEPARPPATPHTARIAESPHGTDAREPVNVFEPCARSIARAIAAAASGTPVGSHRMRRPIRRDARSGHATRPRARRRPLPTSARSGTSGCRHPTCAGRSRSGASSAR